MAKKREALKPGQLEIRRVALTRIKPAAYNPRKDLQPGDPEYEQIARSLDAFGYVDPMVWNRRTGNLVGGHQRYKVLKARGVKRADVSVVDLEAPAEKALNLALNKVKGAWETEGLAALLKELEGEVRGKAAMRLTGFSDEEVARICEEGDQLVELLVPKEAEEEEEPEPGAGNGPSVFQVVVDCRSRKEQERLHERLGKEDFQVKMVTR